MKVAKKSAPFVFLLWHLHKLKDGSQDAKLIGVYSAKHLASAAKRRLSKRRGFCDHPRGFTVAPYQLDRDHWAGGFVTAK
jgi:hypothetical protein